MSKKLSSLKALAVCGAMAAFNIQAAQITGGVLFTGGSLTVNGSLQTATAFTGFSGSKVMLGGQSGSYASVPTGTAVAWTPFTFSPSLFPNPVSPLWTFTIGPTTYSFEATSVTMVQQSPGFLNVKGAGIAHIDGYADTPGNWYIHSTGRSTFFTFGAGSNAVPDGGMTVALLGAAAGVLGLLRTRIS